MYISYYRDWVGFIYVFRIMYVDMRIYMFGCVCIINNEKEGVMNLKEKMGSLCVRVRWEESRGNDVIVL